MTVSFRILSVHKPLNLDSFLALKMISVLIALSKWLVFGLALGWSNRRGCIG
jgi:hypothetical protein